MISADASSKDNITKLPVSGVASRPAPKRIMRPCDYGLMLAVVNLETQAGSVEAYNRLCDAAQAMKAKIDAGNAKAQSPLFATDPAFIYPLHQLLEDR